MSYPGDYTHEREIRQLCDDVLDADGPEGLRTALNEIEKWAVDTLAALWDEAHDDGYTDGVESVDACCWDEDEHRRHVAEESDLQEGDIEFLLEVAREAASAHPDLWALQVAKAGQLRLLRGS